MKQRYGVSEYVATLVITVITLAVGAGLFTYSYYVVDSYYNKLVAVAKGVRGGGGDIAVMASLVDRYGRIVVIGSTGSKPATLYTVFINNTLYAGCNIYIDGETASFTLDGSNYVQIPHYTTFKTVCSTPSGTSRATVKIVYEGGEKTVYASKI